MSSIQIGNFNPPGRGILTALLGDAVDLQPLDGRFSYSYAVVAHPGGSSATFSGSRITPDVTGPYTFSVTSGNDVLTVPCFVFATSVASGMAPSAGAAYSDGEKRGILSSIANAGVPTATLVSWNSGTFPSGIDGTLRAYGGR